MYSNFQAHTLILSVKVLSNDIRRRQYDLLGEESDKMPPSPSPQDKSFKFGPSIFILYLDHFYDYFYHNW